MTHFDRQLIPTIDHAYGMYAVDEFESPTRSTVPLLSWLKHEPAALRSVLDVLGIPETFSKHLEYTVQSPLGEGRPSHTDLMILSQLSSVAIECKWTEPIGETVNTWFGGVHPVNGPLVLEGWLQLLQPFAAHVLDQNCVRQVMNQMIHRAASACAEGVTPQLVYLLFRPSFHSQSAKEQQVRDELAHFWRVLGRPAAFKFWTVTVNVKFTEAYRMIFGLPRGPATVAPVTAALQSNERLFHFGNPVIERIGADA